MRHEVKLYVVKDLNIHDLSVLRALLSKHASDLSLLMLVDQIEVKRFNLTHPQERRLR